MNVLKNFLRRMFNVRSRRHPLSEIHPDEIFLDSSNLPQFDTYQFQGRIEKPLSRNTFISISVIFSICALVFVSRLWFLGVYKGEAYALRSERNRLDESEIFSNRGVIFDRNGVPLAFNTIPPQELEAGGKDNIDNKENNDFALRSYATTSGIAHVVGYVKYPTKDRSGIYFRKNFLGEDGVEKIFNERLSGKNGVKIIETDALGNIHSESTSRQPQDGENITLTVDARLSDAFYTAMKKTAAERGFSGGAAVVMDIQNGDLIVLANYPEYDPKLVTEGDTSTFTAYQKDSRTPFLNRAVAGLYTPGSIIKPIVALAALKEGIIDPSRQILSTGSISIPNPYVPDKPTVFNDWKAHGLVDMRKAIAVSSDVYFYEVGGGFEGRAGLGIGRIEKYLRLFGFGEPTGIILPHEKSGTIPNPTWKEEVFNGDPWRVGDTYNVSIGQYGLQITPVQAVHFTAMIANNGKIVSPRLVSDSDTRSPEPLASFIDIEKKYFDIVHEGMRLAVTEGTAAGLNIPQVEIAAKTGTAELGISKQLVNSWSVGFWPYRNPKYAFAVVMERGPHSNTVGATYVVRQVFDWMSIHTPEYLD